MKGDYIEVRTKAGTNLDVTATVGGRKVESEITKDGNVQWFVARLVTRGGNVLEEIWVPTAEIVGIQRRLREPRENGR